jgi:hypothetical protein
MDQWNGQQRAVAIKMFYMFGFFKSSRFLGSPCIKMGVPEMGWELWTDMARDRIKRWAVVNAPINLRVIKLGIFF